ncbi:multidrug ABC transporter permease [Xylanibacillus composti]|uniref:Multidrug ABC transporter permease n=1 Tax=Xylanibacillus composti TaxID=1572762 RepID=A0A8J4M370_9BACL|nr:multidrug ABC transporter permease [Xylanibacillus composti]MDT9726160.1 multidrug ABC transporter permease [Xylanibacillus composti]GIQ70605.1 hypothetical protein XYCOK13_34290 [Xylanibacillus composti]
MRVLSTVKFTALRMIRNYIVLLLLLVVPIVLISVFAIILSDTVTESGERPLHGIAKIMVVSFQLFAGSIVMSYIQHEFFTAHKMRLGVLPFRKELYAFSIMMCGTVFSILLGVALMTYSQFVLGVPWGNWAWSIYVIALMSVLSSTVCLIFTFSVRNFKLAERLSEVYGVGFIALAGLFFPMPNNAFFDFMGSYGNPLVLSMLSIQAMEQSDAGEAWFTANILLGAIVLLFLLMLALGRRKMA